MSDYKLTRAFVSRAQINDIANKVIGDILPGRPEQPYYEVSDGQNFEIGARLQVRNRVFHYAMAGGSVAPNMGAKIKNPQEVSQEVLGAPASTGDWQITITLDATDGPTYNGRLPADYLRGGYVIVFPAAGGLSFFIRGILHNTAITTAGGTTVLGLDGPIPCDLTITDVAEAIASPYACVVPNTATKLTDNLTSVIGVPASVATIGQYLWLQTWGPCWASPHSGVGNAASDKAAFFVGDGALGQGSEQTGIADKIGVIGQYAGFVLNNDKGGGQGAPFIMLMIDP